MRPGLIRPGNSHQRATAMSWRTSFNEARADSPGKWNNPHSMVRDLVRASMRPGLIRPGNLAGVDISAKERLREIEVVTASVASEARADSPGKLPPDPRFNEARADSPGK